MNLRRLHALSALAIGLFLLIHMGNHVVGLTGQDAHIGYMAVARRFYRNAFVEPLLLLFLVWQMFSGLRLIAKSWSSRSGALAWLQALSGAYLAIFLLIHVGAVLSGRAVFGLDTDFRYAAAGFHVAPWPWFFAPYYFLAVFSLFAHVGCALYWNIAAQAVPTRRFFVASCLIVGAAAGLSFDLAMAGKLFPVEIPRAYLNTYSGAAR